MKIEHPANNSLPPVLLTGATGMIGHAVLADLLRQGRRVACIVRRPTDDALALLTTLLEPLGISAAEAHAQGRLATLTIDLAGDAPLRAATTHSMAGCAVIHAAAETRFHETPDGALRRSNVDGTRALLRLARRLDAERVVLVSTAFVCGDAPGPVRERVAWLGEAHNDYERTKRDAEGLALEFERSSGVPVAILRPSIVVGDWSTGRATKFTGFYMALRAAATLARNTPPGERLTIPLRMLGRPDDPQNIVPLDYVAGAIVHAATRPAPLSAVANLTHPAPPTNADIQRAIEAHFGIAGGRFVDPDEFAALDLSMIERQFLAAQDAIRPYIERPPRFERSNADALDAERGVACPSWDEPSLRRLFSYAQAHEFGRSRVRPRRCADHRCAKYFEDFLPSVLADRALPGGEGVTAVVRFVVRDVPRGAWLCVFEQGRLAKVSRTTNGAAEDFRYETSERAFWRVVTGAEAPQDVFLRGEAEIYGDMERALMMGTLLRRFNELHPVDASALGDRP